MNMNDEVICGYLVTAEKKRSNAVFLEIIQEFDRLCAQAGLRYWVFAGALLGAVRHKGFIPWDDDIDVLMLREDFDRLQEMSQEDFGAREPYFLQNFRTEPACDQSLIRFRRSDTTDIREYDVTFMKMHPELEPYNMGMNIAIFPVDGLPKSRLLRRLQRNAAYALRGAFYRATCPDRTKPVQHALCTAVYRLIGGRNMMKLMHWLYRTPKRVEEDYVQCFNGLYPTGNIWKKSDFDDAAELPFEDIAIRAPIGYVDVLTNMFGDYMQLPPVEKRKEKHDSYTVADVPYTVSLQELLSRS